MKQKSIIEEIMDAGETFKLSRITIVDLLNEAVDGLKKTKCNLEDFECNGCIAHNTLTRMSNIIKGGSYEKTTN